MFTAREFCRLLDGMFRFKVQQYESKIKQGMRMFGHETQSILESESFKEMCIPAMIYFLKSDYIEIKEDTIWKHLKLWAQHHSKMHTHTHCHRRNNSTYMNSNTIDDNGAALKRRLSESSKKQLQHVSSLMGSNSSIEDDINAAKTRGTRRRDSITLDDFEKKEDRNEEKKENDEEQKHAMPHAHPGLVRSLSMDGDEEEEQQKDAFQGTEDIRMTDRAKKHRTLTRLTVFDMYDLDDDGMVEQPVEKRCSDDWVAEDITPFGKASI